MSDELNALARNATLELVPLPPNANAARCKWLFKIKRKANGIIERYKVRLVAKGYTQEEELDHFETFSPVIKPTTIRIVLTIALSHGWPLHQLDVNNAFLHGDLEETVFMQQPPGFTDPLRLTYVCKLKKALYGLKEALRVWFRKFKNFLLTHNFKPAQTDQSLFILNANNITMYILVYVDDIIMTENCNLAIQQLIHSLDSQFSTKDLGALNYFLRIEVGNHKDGIHLTQTRYLQIILEKASMVVAKPCNTPLQARVQLSKMDDTPLFNPL